LLYLIDNETSYMIYMSMGFALILNMWKIVQASKVIKMDKFPYF
jgi:hypothetical protein